MIYLVMGTTGEYSDRQEWPVWAREDKGQAEADVLRLSAAAREYSIKHSYEAKFGEGREKAARRKADLAQMEDPNFTQDYTGTTYFIYEAELKL